MKKINNLKLGLIIIWFSLTFTLVQADSSNNYIFEDGGIDLSGGLSESNSYLLNHTLTYDFRDQSTQSVNYQEITGNTALQIFCSNHIQEPGEECDDGNLNNWDGCSNICLFEGTAICGNNLKENNEECDDGNLNNWDGCSNFCKNENTINDTPTVWGWGGMILLLKKCGNSIKEENEECDDGNLLDGDGCNQQCKTEENLHNIAEEEEIILICGDKILKANETCHEDDLIILDECDTDCEIETKKETTKIIHTSPNIETSFQAVCGNGILEKGEKCDDSNLNNWDGCNYQCQIEANFETIISTPLESEEITNSITQSGTEIIDLEWTEILHGSAESQKITLNFVEVLMLSTFYFIFILDISFKPKKSKLKYLKNFKTR